MLSNVGDGGVQSAGDTIDGLQLLKVEGDAEHGSGESSAIGKGKGSSSIIADKADVIKLVTEAVDRIRTPSGELQHNKSRALAAIDNKQLSLTKKQLIWFANQGSQHTEWRSWVNNTVLVKLSAWLEASSEK